MAAPVLYRVIRGRFILASGEGGFQKHGVSNKGENISIHGKNASRWSDFLCLPFNTMFTRAFSAAKRAFSDHAPAFASIEYVKDKLGTRVTWGNIAGLSLSSFSATIAFVRYETAGLHAQTAFHTAAIKAQLASLDAKCEAKFDRMDQRFTERFDQLTS